MFSPLSYSEDITIDSCDHHAVRVFTKLGTFFIASEPISTADFVIAPSIPYPKLLGKSSVNRYCRKEYAHMKRTLDGRVVFCAVRVVSNNVYD
jgi:hypothetical protein